MGDKLIDLSICIPTFNRASHLDYLLKNISDNGHIIQFSYEIVISDNASTDNTASIIQKWKNVLPIRNYHQKTNLGSFNNINYVFEKARGEFSVFVADDDYIKLFELNQCISEFKEMPSVGIFYTPWEIGTPESSSNRLFYNIDDNLFVRKKSHFNLLVSILQYHIFPEVAIFRTSLYKQLNPVFRQNIAFYFFTLVSDWISITDVYFSNKSFYLSVLDHPRGARKQEGHEQVQFIWDSYRGGLEIMLGKCTKLIDETTNSQLREAINEFIARRISVAIRVRIANKKDNIETYLLAARLRGLGREDLLPVPINLIKTKATFSYIIEKTKLIENGNLLVLLGSFSKEMEAFLRNEFNVKEILICSSISENIRNSSILYTSNYEGDNFRHLNVDKKNNTYFSEAFLMNVKFC